MRRLAPFLCALALVAGCTGSAGTTPNGLATPSATTPVETGPPATSTLRPTASPVAVQAHVTFDGTSCIYSGPRTIPAPATLTLDYAPTPAQEQSTLFIVALRHGTTQTDLDRVDANPAFGVGEGMLVPEFADADSFMGWLGTGSGTYELTVLHDPHGLTGVYDQYFVDCVATMPGRAIPRGGAVLHLVESAPSTSTSAPASAQASR